MALIVEDGSIVAGANTYVSLDVVKTFCAERGVAVPDDATLETKVFMAMDWFEHQPFLSDRVDITTPQPLAFPRVGVTIDGIVTADTEIPKLVIAIVNQATADAITIELEPSVPALPTGALKSKRLDVMEKEFYKPDWASQTPRLTKLMRMLEPLLNGSLASGRLQVNRV